LSANNGSACQSTGGSGSPSGQNHDRDADRRRIDRYISDFPNGVPLSKVIGDIFDKRGTIEPDADYQFTRRYVENADYLKTDRRDGLVWVYPDEYGRRLETQLAYPKTPARHGDDGNGLSGSDETGNSDGKDYAKDRVRKHFEKYTKIQADSIRSWLLQELGTELISIDDRYTGLHEVSSVFS